MSFKKHGICHPSDLFWYNPVLLKQVNQQLSAEAKLAEEQKRLAKLGIDELATIALLHEQLESLKQKNTELSDSLKGKESLFKSHDILILMMLM
jgi:hypothetical protein